MYDKITIYNVYRPLTLTIKKMYLKGSNTCCHNEYQTNKQALEAPYRSRARKFYEISGETVSFNYLINRLLILALPRLLNTSRYCEKRCLRPPERDHFWRWQPQGPHLKMLAHEHFL
jgi:hypothetical protein